MWAAAALGTAMLARQAQQSANSANANEGLLTRQWMNRMSSTAHQREVKDLQAAGLNPNLSAGGSGASSPSASPPRMEPLPTVDMPGIVQAVSLAQEQQKIDIAKQATGADVTKKGAETEFTKGKTGQLPAETRNIEAHTRSLNKGVVRADLESEGAKLLRSFIRYQKDVLRTPNKKDSQDALDLHNQRTNQILGLP